jgi:hypothetical protein
MYQGAFRLDPRVFVDFCFEVFGLWQSIWSEEMFTFSLSLRTQVWYAFLIGGMRCVGCFDRLVSIQSEESVLAVAVKL